MANDKNYPGVSQVKDSAISLLGRLLWDAIYQLQTLSKGPTQGTLSPDTKPVLGMGDAGVLFYSTDFNRLYRWSGAAWTEETASGILVAWLAGALMNSA